MDECTDKMYDGWTSSVHGRRGSPAEASLGWRPKAVSAEPGGVRIKCARTAFMCEGAMRHHHTLQSNTHAYMRESPSTSSSSPSVHALSTPPRSHLAYPPLVGGSMAL